jgi:hypothetical protein
LFRKSLDRHQTAPLSFLNEALERPTAKAVVESMVHGWSLESRTLAGLWSALFLVQIERVLPWLDFDVTEGRVEPLIGPSQDEGS